MYFQNPSETLSMLKTVLENYGNLSGYKVNITKIWLLPLNYKPSKEIRQKYNFKWDTKSIKYLRVLLTQNLDKTQERKYTLNNRIQKDITRWSILVLNFSSRIKIVKIYILPRLLYLFSSSAKIPESQFTESDKTDFSVSMGRSKTKAKIQAPSSR